MITARQWYLSHLDEADYDTSDAIDALVDDIANAPEGEFGVVVRAGITDRLAYHAKAVKVRVTNDDEATIPMFQSLFVAGRRVRAGILKFRYEQTASVASATRARADRNEADAIFWAHNLELHARHKDTDLQGTYDAEGVVYAIVETATGTDG